MGTVGNPNLKKKQKKTQIVINAKKLLHVVCCRNLKTDRQHILGTAYYQDMCLNPGELTLKIKVSVHLLSSRRQNWAGILILSELENVTCFQNTSDFFF